MPRKSDYERILIVEGADDRHSIIGLMQHHTDWPDDSERWPVFVKVGESVDEILAPGYLSAEIKQRKVKSVWCNAGCGWPCRWPLPTSEAAL